MLLLGHTVIVAYAIKVLELGGIMKILFWAVLSIFFVSGSIAQEIPKPRPFGTHDPDCVTIHKIFQDQRYSIGYHSRYKSGVFVYLEKMDLIVIFPLSGPCLNADAALVLERGMPSFSAIFNMILRGHRIRDQPETQPRLGSMLDWL